jgi:hypothetical protein
MDLRGSPTRISRDIACGCFRYHCNSFDNFDNTSFQSADKFQMEKFTKDKENHSQKPEKIGDPIQKSIFFRLTRGGFFG